MIEKPSPSVNGDDSAFETIDGELYFRKSPSLSIFLGPVPAVKHVDRDGLQHIELTVEKNGQAAAVELPAGALYHANGRALAKELISIGVYLVVRFN